VSTAKSSPPRGASGSAKHTSSLLTPDELAARWSVPKSQCYRLAREGKLPAVRIGRYVRFAVAAVERFEEEGGADA
jgi:excisionase family DNA binding protein